MVAFHATLSNDLVNYPNKKPVIFNNVKVNVGGGYDGTTGIFTCPESGVYVFDWSVLTKANKYFHTELVVNGTRQAVNNLHASSLKHRQATTMTIVELNKSDAVWIQQYAHYVGQFAHGNDWTKFSGYKL